MMTVQSNSQSKVDCAMCYCVSSEVLQVTQAVRIIYSFLRDVEFGKEIGQGGFGSVYKVFKKKSWSGLA